MDRAKVCSILGKLLITGDCSLDEEAEAAKGDETTPAEDFEVDIAVFDFVLPADECSGFS